MPEDLRARILGAIERSQQAHSGRIRIETNRRDGERPEVIAETGAIDFTFDETAGVLELRQEVDWPIKKYKAVTERRFFGTSGLIYTRKIEIGSRFLEPEEVLNGIPEQFDDSLSPASELWVRNTMAQEGFTLGEMLATNPSLPFYSWLRTALENEAVPIRIVSDNAEATTIELWAQGELLTAETKGILPVQVTLAGGEISVIAADLPPANEYGSYEHFSARQWRMGKSVLVVEPGPAECRPDREPVHTQIKDIRLNSVKRVVGFIRAGKTWLIAPDWSHIQAEPYRALAVGDQIRLWGETKPLPGAFYYLPDMDLTLVPGAEAFHIWGAEYSDGVALYSTRPPDDASEVDESLVGRYHNLDVRGELVTLTFAVILEEDILAFFIDDVGEKCDDITLGTAAQFDLENNISLDRSTIDAYHIVEGTPVVAYTAELGRDVYIWQVTLADGTVIYPKMP